jgi:hypothetical protein
MALESGWFGSLTEEQANRIQARLAERAEVEGLGISFRRAAEGGGLVALGCFVAPPPQAAAGAAKAC